uniref:Uncharacterized protein n=1 Tax=Alexandrium monilatum TaxID=311494 RepID=A0A7S4R7L9_9DINO|mmetsp:Transcript_61858/g.191525  ORF Transcript_61858/g.191525 Transcript_61858/m.191525 type:complete len:597 (+) Transcript_61858:61-1851(+)
MQMAGRPQPGVSPRRELSQKLQSRQATSEARGAVFESSPVRKSNADMVWNQVTASQFTPRHDDPASTHRVGKEEEAGQACASASSSAAPVGGGASPRRGGGSSSRSADLDKTTEELNATVSELRETMEKERERSRQLEKRASEAEYIAVWLKEELDKSVATADLNGTRPVVDHAPQAADLDGTQPVLRHGIQNVEMDSTQPVVRRRASAIQASSVPEDEVVPTRPQLGVVDPTATAPKLGVLDPAGTVPKLCSLVTPGTQPKLGLASLQPDTVGRLHPMAVQRMPSFDDEPLDISNIEDPRMLREELAKSHRYIEEKQHEVIGLEEQNLVLREELNMEKQKVIELKRAANSQKEQNQKAHDELEMNRWLHEEVQLLRNEAAKLQEKLQQAAQREQFLKTELADLRQAAGKASDLHSEEMGRLSVTVGEQLVTVERELAQRTRELSEATDPFIKHAHGLLGAARKACMQIEGASGRSRQAPPLYDLRSRDLANSFRGILKLLKYMVEVLAQHTGMVNPFEQGLGYACVSETSDSLASSMQDYHLQGSQQRGLVCHSALESQQSAQARPGDARGEEEDGVGVVRNDNVVRRWMCYMQD